MMLTHMEMRKLVLADFERYRTCSLAQELCKLVYYNKRFLNPEDIYRCCSFIASLCLEAGCEEASESCVKAAEAVMKDEKRHLELCEQSCTLRYEDRFHAEPKSKNAAYIT